MSRLPIWLRAVRFALLMPVPAMILVPWLLASHAEAHRFDLPPWVRLIGLFPLVAGATMWVAAVVDFVRSAGERPRRGTRRRTWSCTGRTGRCATRCTSR